MLLTDRPSRLVQLDIHIVDYFCLASIGVSNLRANHADQSRSDLKIQVDVKS